MHSFMSLVHVKQNGNGTTYPVRPYRSKDHLIPYESSTLYRNTLPFKSIYSPEDEIISNRRNTLKETDLDLIFNSSNEQSDETIKTLPINRNRTVDLQQDEYIEPNQIPITMQRRSSFQVATKLNNIDFSTKTEAFYFLDKQLIKSTQRNHYSPEHYQDKRREYSPYLNQQQNNLIVANGMLTNGYINKTNSKNDQQSYENNRDNFKEKKKFILNNNVQNEDYHRDDGIFV